MKWPTEQVLDRRSLDDAPRIHHEDPLGEFGDYAHVVREIMILRSSVSAIMPNGGLWRKAVVEVWMLDLASSRWLDLAQTS
jgi:hypothetical protein